MANQHEYEAQQILGVKYCPRASIHLLSSDRYYYLIKWKNWELLSSTWEPEENLINVDELIQEYEELHHQGKQPFDWEKYHTFQQFWNKSATQHQPHNHHHIQKKRGRFKNNVKKLKWRSMCHKDQEPHPPPFIIIKQEKQHQPPHCHIIIDQPTNQPPPQPTQPPTANQCSQPAEGHHCSNSNPHQPQQLKPTKQQDSNQKIQEQWLGNSHLPTTQNTQQLPSCTQRTTQKYQVNAKAAQPSAINKSSSGSAIRYSVAAEQQELPRSSNQLQFNKEPQTIQQPNPIQQPSTPSSQPSQSFIICKDEEEEKQVPSQPQPQQFQVLGIHRNADSSISYLVCSNGHKQWKSKAQITALCPGQAISYYEQSVVFTPISRNNR